MLQGLRVSHKTATRKFIFCSSCCWVFVSDPSNFARDKRRTLLLFLHFLHVALTACYMYLFAGYVKVNRPKFIYQNHPSLMPRLVRKSQELNILEHQQCQLMMCLGFHVKSHHHKILLTLSLPRVINFNFLFQFLTRDISYSMENLAIDSLLRWKLIE